MIKSIKISYSILLLLGSLIYSVQGFGQVSNTPEKVDLLCDRSVYISGEPISFTGHLSFLNDSTYMSEVAYVEIISPDGQRLNKAKFSIVDGSFDGQILIPVDAISGYYFLRSYTKWMRNGSPENYAYIKFKLINPLQEDMMELSDSLVDTSKTFIESVQSINAFEKTASTIKANEVFEIRLDNLNSEYKSTSLSIVPKMTGQFTEYESEKSSDDYSMISYIPETRGLTISGEVIDKSSKEKLPYYKVSLHIGEDKNFISVLSDSSGKFYISLPKKYFMQELFIIAASNEGKEVEVLIDQDYCTKKVHLKVPPFSVSKEEKTHLLLMAQTLQLHDSYQSIDSVADFIENIPFYGHPYKSIDFDSFVELDSLSQYFTDIPSWVHIKKHKGVRKLYLSGEETELLHTDALILIDWVPVDDDEAVLKMDYRRIKKFEVIVTPYIHGGIIYGGMINIFTRNGDFAGFPFPKSAMYINYDFYSDNNQLDKNSKASILTNTPTWINDLSIESLEEGLELVAPSISGEYEILLQTIDKEGKKTIYRKEFEVL